MFFLKYKIKAQIQGFHKSYCVIFFAADIVHETLVK